MDYGKKSSKEIEHIENYTYHQGGISKEEIISGLRRKGCRITRQRKILIDIILQEEYTCCKEIYYLAVKVLPDIGLATIYRMLNVLEEIGAIKRENSYRVCSVKDTSVERCSVRLEDNTTVELDNLSLQRVIEKGMAACGYSDGKRINNLLMQYKS